MPFNVGDCVVFVLRSFWDECDVVCYGQVQMRLGEKGNTYIVRKFAGGVYIREGKNLTLMTNEEALLYKLESYV